MEDLQRNQKSCGTCSSDTEAADSLDREKVVLCVDFRSPVKSLHDLQHSTPFTYINALGPSWCRMRICSALLKLFSRLQMHHRE